MELLADPGSRPDRRPRDTALGLPARARRAAARPPPPPQASSASRSSIVSRRRITRASASRTSTAAGRGTALYALLIGSVYAPVTGTARMSPRRGGRGGRPRGRREPLAVDQHVSRLAVLARDRVGAVRRVGGAIREQRCVPPPV